MNKSNYTKQQYTAIGQYQLLFWFLIFLSSIVLKNLKHELIIDLNSIFHGNFLHNSGKVLSFLMAWVFIFIYYHCFSISTNSIYSSFLSLIRYNLKKLRNPKIHFSYTHLTLPTKRIVCILVATLSVKKKTTGENSLRV